MTKQPLKEVSIWRSRKCHDELRVRRWLAFVSAIYALFIWPHLVILYNKVYHISDDLAMALLTYIGIIGSGPLAAYYWAAMQKQRSETNDL